jgi:hypothetical protein
MKLTTTIVSIAALSVGLIGQSIAAGTSAAIQTQCILKANSPHHAGRATNNARAASTLGSATALLGGFSFRPPAGYVYGLKTFTFPNAIGQGYQWIGPKRADGTQPALFAFAAIPIRGYRLLLKDTSTSDFIENILQVAQSDPAYYHSDMSGVMINNLPFLREYGRRSAESGTAADDNSSTSPTEFSNSAHVYNIDEPQQAPNPTPQADPPSPVASKALEHFLVYACTTPTGIICFIGSDSEPYNKTTLPKLEACIMTVKNPAY